MIAMRVSDFSYKLPENLIALHPPTQRGKSRLMVVHKTSEALEHRSYEDLVDYLKPGDVVVLNDTKVIKARLIATNAKGQKRELLLLEDHHNTNFLTRRCLYRGGIKTNEYLDVDGTAIRVTKVYDGGIAEIESSSSLLDLAEKEGTVPLPPYLHREASSDDLSRYQTVFAKKPGSVAAPTASLNFTEELNNRLLAKGARIEFLTLHVGLGTFLPIRSENLDQHVMHSEYFEIPTKTIDAVRAAKLDGGRIIALGTTVARTLEYCADQLLSDRKTENQPTKPLNGEADIFIYPGYKFKVVDGLVTNFHAPKSTVLMLAATFAGWDKLQKAYAAAKANNYAFLSYGDSMLII